VRRQTCVYFRPIYKNYLTLKNKRGRKLTRLCVSKLMNFSSICLNMGMKFVPIEKMDYLNHYLYVIQSKW
jgi:hypothetical protein